MTCDEWYDNRTDADEEPTHRPSEASKRLAQGRSVKHVYILLDSDSLLEILPILRFLGSQSFACEQLGFIIALGRVECIFVFFRDYDGWLFRHCKRFWLRLGLICSSRIRCGSECNRYRLTDDAVVPFGHHWNVLSKLEHRLSFKKVQIKFISNMTHSDFK